MLLPTDNDLEDIGVTPVEARLQEALDYWQSEATAAKSRYHAYHGIAGHEMVAGYCSGREDACKNFVTCLGNLIAAIAEPESEPERSDGERRRNETNPAAGSK